MGIDTLAVWFKIHIIFVLIAGLLTYFCFLPLLGDLFVAVYPEYKEFYKPWLYFLWGTGVPILIALFIGWKISTNISYEKVFVVQNVILLKFVSGLAIVDTIYYAVGNIILGEFYGASSPGVFLVSIVFDVMGIFVSLFAMTLAKICKKGIALEEEVELTI